MVVNREVQESPLEQGEDEKITYTLTTTPWGSNPASITVTLKDVSDPSIDTSSMIAGSNGTAVGDVITLPEIRLLTPWRTYRVEVKFTVGGNVEETYFIIKATV